MCFENVIGILIQNIHLFQDDKVKENLHYLVMIDSCDYLMQCTYWLVRKSYSKPVLGWWNEADDGCCQNHFTFLILWDLRFSQQCLWMLLSSGKSYHVSFRRAYNVRLSITEMKMEGIVSSSITSLNHLAVPLYAVMASYPQSNCESVINTKVCKILTKQVCVCVCVCVCVVCVCMYQRKP